MCHLGFFQYIYNDIWSALNALVSSLTNESKLISDYIELLKRIAVDSPVTRIWITGRCANRGNERANELTESAACQINN